MQTTHLHCKLETLRPPNAHCGACRASEHSAIQTTSCCAPNHLLFRACVPSRVIQGDGLAYLKVYL